MTGCYGYMYMYIVYTIVNVKINVHQYAILSLLEGAWM